MILNDREKLRVLRNEKHWDEYSPEYYIVNESNIEENVNLCETFDSYGQQVGCHDSGCYSAYNSDCDFINGDEEDHVLCDCITYWDGSNHKSVILSYEFNAYEIDATLLDENDKISKKILDAFEDYDTYIENGAVKTETINGIEFENNRYSGFEIATATIL